MSKILKQEFEWGSKGATLGRLTELKISLPVDSKGKPDWIYMENYIKDIYKKIEGVLK